MYGLLLALLVGWVEGARKEWLGTQSWALGSSWSSGRPPCPGDSILLPEGQTIPLVLKTGENRVASITFSDTGHLVMLSRSSIVFSNATDPDCQSTQGAESVFVGGVVGHWLDPRRWSGYTPITPHLLGIPCTRDTVVFPPPATFVIQMPEVPVHVAQMFIGNKEMWGEEWRAVVDSEMLNVEFLSPVANTPPDGLNVEVVPGSECQECDCATEHLRPYVCPLVPCPPPRCLQPFQPLAFCCQTCAGVIQYSFDENALNISQLEGLVRVYLKSEDLNLIFHVGRIRDKIQIVVADPDPDTWYTDPDSYLSDLNAFIMSERQKEMMSLKNEMIRGSGPLLVPSSWLEQLGTLVLLMLMALLTMTVIVLCHYEGRLPELRLDELWSRLPPGDVLFARFENTQGEVEIAREPIQDCSVIRAFDNPMFSSIIPEEIKEESSCSSEAS